MEKRGHETDLTLGRIVHLKTCLEDILAQVEPAIQQAHERIIGERRLKYEGKILSLYDTDLNILVRGKARASIKLGNKLWLDETREILITDYLLEREQTGDNKHVLPTIDRLTEEQNFPVKSV